MDKATTLATTLTNILTTLEANQKWVVKSVSYLNIRLKKLTTHQYVLDTMLTTMNTALTDTYDLNTSNRVKS